MEEKWLLTEMSTAELSEIISQAAEWETLRAALASYAQYAWEEDVLEISDDCFPESDTRVLTDSGLLYVDQIEARLRRGERVQYACYEADSEALCYRPGKLVFPPAKRHQQLLCFTAEEQRETEPGEDEAMLRVTPSHRMLVRQSGRRRPRVVLASSLHSPCRCRPSAQPCVHQTASFSMLTAVQHGYVSHSTRSEGGEESAVRRRASLQLLGFALHDRHFKATGQHHCKTATPVTFSPLSTNEYSWLVNRCVAAGLTESEYCSNGDVFTVAQPPWTPWLQRPSDDDDSSVPAISVTRFSSDDQCNDSSSDSHSSNTSPDGQRLDDEYECGGQGGSERCPGGCCTCQPLSCVASSTACSAQTGRWIRDRSVPTMLPSATS